MERFEFHEDEAGGGFDLYIDDVHIGDITFRNRNESAISINHTGVKKEFENNGYGTMLVKKAMEYAEENELRVSASCWFADKIIREESE